MLQKLRIYVACTIIVSIAGCVAVGSRFKYSGEPAGPESRVYLYRSFSLLGSAASPNVYLDGVRLGKLHTGGYVEMNVPEGQHELVVGRLGDDRPNWGPSNAIYIIDAGSGLEFFLKMNMDYSRVSTYVVPVGPSPIVGTSGTVSITIEAMDKQSAVDELSGTNKID